jgi:hypothetical protein
VAIGSARRNTGVGQIGIGGPEATGARGVGGAGASWELGTDIVSLGAVSVVVDGACSRTGDSARGSLHNLVMRGAGLGMLRHTAPSDTIPTPGSSGVAGLGIADCSCPVPSVLRPRLSPGGRWRTTQSMHVHRSPLQRGCYEIHWPRLVGISWI